MNKNNIFFIIIVLLGLFFYLIKTSKVDNSGLVPPIEMYKPDVDLVLKEIRLIKKNGNKLIVDLVADKAVINQKKNKILLDNFEGTLYQNENYPVMFFSDVGWLDEETNSFDMNGNVYLNLEQNITLYSDSLRWDTKTNKFLTDDLVIVQGDTFTMSGSGMVCNVDDQSIKLQKNVSGSFSIQ